MTSSWGIDPPSCRACASFGKVERLSILASDRIVNGPNDALQQYKLGILSREINKFKYFST